MKTNLNNQRLLEKHTQLIALQVKIRLEKSDTELGEHNRGGYRLFMPEVKRYIGKDFELTTQDVIAICFALEEYNHQYNQHVLQLFKDEATKLVGNIPTNYEFESHYELFRHDGDEIFRVDLTGEGED
jgi:hypothetical protein